VFLCRNRTPSPCVSSLEPDAAAVRPCRRFASVSAAPRPRPCREPVCACSPLAARHSLYSSKPNLSCVPAHGQRPCLCAAQPSRAALPQCQDDDAELKPLPGATTTSTATSTRKLNMSLQHTDTPQPQTQVRHDQAWNTPRPRPNRQTVPSSPMSRRELAVANHRKRERTIDLTKPTCGATAALPRSLAAGTSRTGHAGHRAHACRQRPSRLPLSSHAPTTIQVAANQLTLDTVSARLHTPIHPSSNHRRFLYKNKRGITSCIHLTLIIAHINTCFALLPFSFTKIKRKIHTPFNLFKVSNLHNLPK